MPLPYDSLLHQDGGAFHSGTLALRPPAQLMGTTDQFYWATDPLTTPGGQTLYVTTLQGGVLVWVAVGGAGSGSATAAMKYFVNNSPTASPQPLCLYSTIAAAQTAAVADGHNAANPAVLWLLPTALPFTENVTMAAGISMQGMVSAAFGAAAPVITGNVDASLGGGNGSVVLSDLIINGQLSCTGTKTVNIQIDNVTVFQTDAQVAPVLFSNANLVVTSNRFSVLCLAGSVAAAVDITNAVTWTATEGQIITDSDRVAISAVNAAGTLVVNMMEVRIQGTLAITNLVAVTMRQGRTVTSSKLCTFTTAGTLKLFNCEITIGDGTVVSLGPGNTSAVDCFYPSGTTGVGTTVVTSTVNYVNRLHTEITFEGVGPYAVTTLADEYLIDTASGGAGNKTVNLPALNTVPQGTRLRFQKQISTANTLTLARNGGAATIGGIAADFVLAAGSLTGATLQAGATDWRIAAN